jgi:hypothetical protein
MELLECDLDKQAESGITAAKYALTAECWRSNTTVSSQAHCKGTDFFYLRVVQFLT